MFLYQVAFMECKHQGRLLQLWQGLHLTNLMVPMNSHRNMCRYNIIIIIITLLAKWTQKLLVFL